MRSYFVLPSSLLVLFATFLPASAAEKSYRSHSPQRPLPVASSRPLTDGPAFYVDATKGNDRNNGSKQQPWKTASHAVEKLKPGTTLYFRAGTYYEQIKVPVSGATKQPITLRAYPGELVVIDAGFREFYESPTTSWEPVEGGASDEFRSTKTYPNLERAIGNFGDSLLPLHSYKFDYDFQAEHEALQKVGDAEVASFYLGPGLLYDAQTQRIHVRLKHTHIKAFGSGNYRGETDPRKLPLVVSGWNQTPLTLEGVSHVRIQDLVFRGGGDSTILVKHCEQITFDGITLFNAKAGLRVETTGHLRVVNSAFHGTMPPWGSRSASKGRTVNSHLFVPMGTYKHLITEREYLSPQCHDFEIAHCTFTDGHDGVYVGGVKRFAFHHNMLDNMNDDGVYLSAWGPPGSDVHIYQNRLSRCLTMFAFGLGRGSESEPGSGTFVYRNLIDQRAPIPYGHPAPDEPELTSYGRLCGDHGGPVWEPLNFYHNTVVMRAGAFRNYYGSGLGGHMRGSKRQVINNIFVQIEQLPGLNFDSPDVDLRTSSNLLWSIQEGPASEGDFFAKFRASSVFATSQKKHSPGWTSGDLFANPWIHQLTPQWQQPLDIRLRGNSASVDAGLAIPSIWPDPLRSSDKNKPDIGALPVGTDASNLGPAK